MTRSIGTGFDVLARVLSYHPETAFIRAFVSFPAVELGSEAVPSRPLSPDHDFTQVLRVPVAALYPLTHLSPHQYIVRNSTTNSAANSPRSGMDSSLPVSGQMERTPGASPDASGLAALAPRLVRCSMAAHSSNSTNSPSAFNWYQVSGSTPFSPTLLARIWIRRPSSSR